MQNCNIRNNYISRHGECSDKINQSVLPNFIHLAVTSAGLTHDIFMWHETVSSFIKKNCRTGSPTPAGSNVTHEDCKKGIGNNDASVQQRLPNNSTISTYHTKILRISFKQTNSSSLFQETRFDRFKYKSIF